MNVKVTVQDNGIDVECLDCGLGCPISGLANVNCIAEFVGRHRNCHTEPANPIQANRSAVADRVKRYVATKGVRCPYCDSNDLLYGDDWDKDEMHYQNVTCESCRRKWADEFKLNGIADFD